MEIILTINWLPGCARPAPWRKFSADSTTQIRGCSDPFSFLFFFCETELLLQSPAHFSDLIFQRCSKSGSFSTCSSQIELSLQSRALFVNNFPRSMPALVETETLLRRPQEPHYPEKHRVSRPRVFSPVNSHASELLHFPTT